MQVIGSWNTSPDEVVTGNNIVSFKSKLNEYWKLKEHGYAEGLTAYCYLLSSQTAGYRITQCTWLTCNTCHAHSPLSRHKKLWKLDDVKIFY